MIEDVFKFELDRSVPLRDAEESLQLSMIALEGLVGTARVRLDCEYHLDKPHHAIIVDGTTTLGASLVRIYTGILLREFGEEAFSVRRIRPARATGSRKAVAR